MPDKLKMFRVAPSIDTRVMSRIVDDLRHSLSIIQEHSEQEPGNLDLNDIYSLAVSLVKGQRYDIKGLKDGSWCVAPNIKDMPGDTRVDFVFFPTYIAVSILTKIVLDYESVANRVDSIKTVLQQGMIFSTYRQLSGHGYEGTSQMLDAIRIFNQGKVPLFLKIYPSFSPRLEEIFKSIKHCIEEAVRTNSTRGIWGEDYTDGFKEILNIFDEQIISPSYAELEKQRVELGVLLNRLREQCRGSNNVSYAMNHIVGIVEDRLKQADHSIGLIVKQLEELEREYTTIRNSDLSDEDKLSRMSDVIDQVRYDAEYRNRVSSWLNGWESLHNQTKVFLPSAEYLFDLLTINQTDDFSPFILQYCRSLENELLQKMFLAYVDDISLRKEEMKDALEEARSSNILKSAKQFSEALTGGKRKYTLGEMHFVMNLLKEDGNTYRKSRLLQDFRKFILRFFEARILEGSYLETIARINNEFRIKSAHPYIINQESANLCREEVRKALNSFLRNYRTDIESEN